MDNPKKLNMENLLISLNIMDENDQEIYLSSPSYLTKARNSLELTKRKMAVKNHLLASPSGSYKRDDSVDTEGSNYEADMVVYLETSSYHRDLSVSEKSTCEINARSAITFSAFFDLFVNRKDYLKNAVIQFTYKYFPKDIAYKLAELERKDYHFTIYFEVIQVLGEFNKNWDVAKSEIQNYKEKVITRELTKYDVIEHVNEFQTVEQDNQKYFIEFIDFYNNFDENKQLIEAEITEVCDLFEKFMTYIEHFKQKIESMDSKEDDELVDELVKEVDLYAEWFDMTYQDATVLFHKVVDEKIFQIIKGVTESSTNVCGVLKEKISELEIKLAKKKKDYINSRNLKEEESILKAIAEVLEKKWNLGGVRKLRHLLIQAQTDLTDTTEKVEEADPLLKSEISKLMIDSTLVMKVKAELLDHLKEQHELKLIRLTTKIRRLEKGLHKLRHVTKIEINKQRRTVNIDFDFDEFGRFYKDELGQKIYKEVDSENEYIQNEDGEFIKFKRMPYKPVQCEAPVRLEDCEYLKENVGAALMRGLEKICLYQPSDPIEYLALWLLNYKNYIENCQKKRLVESKSEEQQTDTQETDSYEDQYYGEESVLDFNLLTYKTPQETLLPEDI